MRIFAEGAGRITRNDRQPQSCVPFLAAQANDEKLSRSPVDAHLNPVEISINLTRFFRQSREMKWWQIVREAPDFSKAVMWLDRCDESSQYTLLDE